MPRSKKRRVLSGNVGPYSIKAAIGSEEELQEDGAKLAGMYFREGQQRCILLAGDMDSMEFFDTLLHKLEHAINRIYGLEEDHAKLHVRATAIAQWLVESGLVDPVKVRRAFK